MCTCPSLGPDENAISKGAFEVVLCGARPPDPPDLVSLNFPPQFLMVIDSGRHRGLGHIQGLAPALGVFKCPPRLLQYKIKTENHYPK
jgi:hypothetical protein